MSPQGSPAQFTRNCTRKKENTLELLYYFLMFRSVSVVISFFLYLLQWLYCTLSLLNKQYNKKIKIPACATISKLDNRQQIQMQFQYVHFLLLLYRFTRACLDGLSLSCCLTFKRWCVLAVVFRACKLCFLLSWGGGGYFAGLVYQLQAAEYVSLGFVCWVNPSHSASVW